MTKAKTPFLEADKQAATDGAVVVITFLRTRPWSVPLDQFIGLNQDFRWDHEAKLLGGFKPPRQNRQKKALSRRPEIA